jgi:hypothetical protein
VLEMNSTKRLTIQNSGLGEFLNFATSKTARMTLETICGHFEVDSVIAKKSLFFFELVF